MNSSGLGYLIAFLAMIVGGLSTFPFTDVARKWGPVAVNHFRLLVAFIVLSIIVMVMDKKTPITLFTAPSATEYFYLCTSGIMGLAVGDYFGFHCLAILGEKKYSILNTIAPGAALGFGFIMIGERMDFIGIIGMAITISGMIWFIQASDTKELDKHVTHEYGKISKGVLFGVLSGVCQGLHMTLSKKALTGETALISPVHATWIRVLGATAGYFLFTIATGKLKEHVIDPIKKEKETLLKATLSTIFGLVLSIVLVMWSLSLCKVAIAQTILSLTPLIIMPMAYFLYKEKITAKTIFAGLVSILGVYVLIWRDDIATILGLHLH
ncbi:MAG TPA: DMT family transporter [Bacteroidia bacterium]|jgi:drug/metabolite transporter (DMT)-like permease|nr:DMT family transporter [Bacteroidia bacterium]